MNIKIRLITIFLAVFTIASIAQSQSIFDFDAVNSLTDKWSSNSFSTTKKIGDTYHTSYSDNSYSSTKKIGDRDYTLNSDGSESFGYYSGDTYFETTYDN